MYRNPITFTLLATAIASLPSSAGASTYRNLCMSAPAYCTPTGTQVPRLDADVCLSRDGRLELKGSDSCPLGAWPYYVEHGEVVDPWTGFVEAYLPLDNACEQEGICVDGPPPDGSQEYPMCCYTDMDGDQICVDGVNCGGTIWYCYDGVSNSDGTITCFAAEQW
jgi:hypothetical protein